MGSISLYDVSYLSFVVPGAVLVGVFSYFTRSQKMGEVEFAAWSFVWGAAMFITFSVMGVFPADAPITSFSSLLGAFVSWAFIMSFIVVVIGYVAACVANRSLIRNFQSKLFDFAGTPNRTK